MPESYLAPEIVQRLRDIARYRRFLGQESRRLKGKIMLDLLKHGHFVEKNPVETETGRAWLRTIEPPEIKSTFTVLETVREELRELEKKR